MLGDIFCCVVINIVKHVLGFLRGFEVKGVCGVVVCVE